MHDQTPGSRCPPAADDRTQSYVARRALPPITERLAVLAPHWGLKIRQRCLELTDSEGDNMKQLMRIFIMTLAMALLAGCGNLQRQSREFQTTGTNGITIDASQRAIYSVTKKYPGGAQWQAFCAEPSPDALSALASSFGLDASAAGKALGMAISSQDSTASIGLRTQTIQILRDAMYRLCEGYASGALDNVGFTRMQRRYQHIMLALLAIEQLTGPVVAQQMALTGSAGASLGKGLGEISKLLAQGAADLASADMALADAQAEEKRLDAEHKASAADQKNATQTAELKIKLDLAQKDTKNKKNKATAAKTYYATLESNLKEAERIVTQVSGSVTPVSPVGGGRVDASSINTVSKDVRKIVTALIDHDYTKDLCADVLLSKEADEIVGATTFAVVAHMCAASFNMTPEATTKFLNSVKERTEAVKAAVKSRQSPPKETLQN